MPIIRNYFYKDFFTFATSLVWFLLVMLSSMTIFIKKQALFTCIEVKRVRITLDTVHDSPETIKRVISMLTAIVATHHNSNYVDKNNYQSAKTQEHSYVDFFGNDTSSQINSSNSQASSSAGNGYADLFSTSTQKNEHDLFMENESSSHQASNHVALQSNGSSQSFGIFDMFNSQSTSSAPVSSVGDSQNSVLDMLSSSVPDTSSSNMSSSSAADILDAASYFEELDSDSNQNNNVNSLSSNAPSNVQNNTSYNAPSNYDVSNNYNAPSNMAPRAQDVVKQFTNNASFNEIFANLAQYKTPAKQTNPRIEPYN